MPRVFEGEFVKVNDIDRNTQHLIHASISSKPNYDILFFSCR